MGRPMIKYAFDAKVIFYIHDDNPEDATRTAKEKLENLFPGAWKITRIGEKLEP